MTRNIKALGAALAAAMAMGAMIASAAPAAGELEVDMDANGRASLTGSRTGPEHAEHTFVIDGTTPTGKVTRRCKVATLEGTVSGGPANEKATVTQLAVAPTLAECSASTLTAHVRMNGCQYLFKGVAEKTATLDITGCTAGKTIETEITAFGTCKVTIGEQANLNHVKFVNKGGASTTEMHVTVEMALTGITYTESAACPDPGVHNDGTYTGNFTYKAFKDAGGKEVTKHGHTYIELVCGTQLGLTAT